MGRSFIEKIMEKLGDTETDRQAVSLNVLLHILDQLKRDVSCDSVAVTFDSKTLYFTAHKGDRSKAHAVPLIELKTIVGMSIMYKSTVAALREGLTG